MSEDGKRVGVPMNFLPFKGHRLVLDDIERAHSQHERDLVMRRVVRKGMRRFWSMVLVVIVDGVAVVKFGLWGLAAAFICEAAIWFVLYAVMDF